MNSAFGAPTANEDLVADAVAAVALPEELAEFALVVVPVDLADLEEACLV